MRKKANEWVCVGHTLADGGNILDQLLELVWRLLLVGIFLEKIDALYAVSGGRAKRAGRAYEQKLLDVGKLLLPGLHLRRHSCLQYQQNHDSPGSHGHAAHVTLTCLLFEARLRSDVTRV